MVRCAEEEGEEGKTALIDQRAALLVKMSFESLHFNVRIRP